MTTATTINRSPPTPAPTAVTTGNSSAVRASGQETLILNFLQLNQSNSLESILSYIKVKVYMFI